MHDVPGGDSHDLATGVDAQPAPLIDRCGRAHDLVAT
jgi:hypothetical protein